MTFTWPVPDHYGVSSGYADQRDYGLHGGFDIPAPTVPCVAISAGRIIFANWAGSAGRSVWLDMGTYRVHYCHLSGFNVTAGQAVAAGDVIGWVGGSGHGADNCYASHLHLNLFAAQRPATGPSHWVAWVGMWAVDPELYLSKEDDMTPEEHAWLAAIHHRSVVMEPDERAHLHHHVHVLLPGLIAKLKELLDAIRAHR